MPDTPRQTPLLPNEVVTRKSKGFGVSAYLWFDDKGKIYTKKPCPGDAFLTNQRVIFEGTEAASAWQNLAGMVFWPASIFLGPGSLNLAVPISNVTEICKSNQIRAEPIKITHSKTDVPSPLYFSFNDKDAWIEDIQTIMRQNLGFLTPSESPPPPPPDFSTPVCPTCGSPLSYMEQCQKWVCPKDKKHSE
jgi:hypothetical protein